MATKLYLAKATGPPVGSLDERLLILTQDTGSLEAVDTTTTASGNHIPVGPALADLLWYSNPLDGVTISGTITANFWMSESAMTVNAQAAIIIARCDNAGVFISSIVAQANAAHADGVELGTSRAAMNWTITPTSRTLSAGDRIRVAVKVDAIGTMAAGTVSTAFGGPTAAADGDSWVQFTETITEQAAAPFIPHRNPMPPLIAQ